MSRPVRIKRCLQVCLSTVGVLGDICRNVEEGILPQCDEIMSILVTNLGREDVHRTIKPQILSSFGDIALVVGEKFDKYVDAVLRVLKQAMALSVQSAQAAGGWRPHEPRRGVSNSRMPYVQRFFLLCSMSIHVLC